MTYDSKHKRNANEKNAYDSEQKTCATEHTDNVLELTNTHWSVSLLTNYFCGYLIFAKA